MTIRFVALAALIASSCGVAAAQEISGHYKMEGTSTTGSNYTGSAEITMTSESDCHITFSDGFAGICILKGTIFALAFIVHGKAGLSVYEIASDGSLQGLFIDDFHGGGIGREKLTPIR